MMNWSRLAVTHIWVTRYLMEKRFCGSLQLQRFIHVALQQTPTVATLSGRAMPSSPCGNSGHDCKCKSGKWILAIVLVVLASDSSSFTAVQGFYCADNFSSSTSFGVIKPRELLRRRGRPPFPPKTMTPVFADTLREKASTCTDSGREGRGAN